MAHYETEERTIAIHKLVEILGINLTQAKTLADVLIDAACSEYRHHQALDKSYVPRVQQIRAENREIYDHSADPSTGTA